MLKHSRIVLAGVVTAMSLVSTWAYAEPSPTRHVELTYAATIEQIPEGAKVIDLWLPVASDTDGQKVLSVDVIWPEGGAIATERKYGNRIYHKRFTAPFPKDFAVTLKQLRKWASVRAR